MLEGVEPCDLITGTPPYFDPKAATPCADEQRRYAKFEMRGGIEAYAQAAARHLAPGGLFVVCAPAVPIDRGANAIASAGLHIRWRRPVLPGPDRAAFLELIVASRERSDPVSAPALLLREADGRRSLSHAEIREWFGVPASEY